MIKKRRPSYLFGLLISWRSWISQNMTGWKAKQSKQFRERERGISILINSIGKNLMLYGDLNMDVT
jgi:hypothetical protein